MKTERCPDAAEQAVVSVEPDNDSYVLVEIRSGVQAFHRDDQLAADLDLGLSPAVWHWFEIGATGLRPTNPGSWLELCGGGKLAYVGPFVERLAAA